MNRSDYAEFIRVLCEEAKDDVVGLWAIAWDIQHVNPDIGHDDLVAAVEAVVLASLSSGAVVAGMFTDQDDGTALFVPWQLAPADVVERIRVTWAALGRDPHPGEVAWFVSPDCLPFRLLPPP